MGPLDLTVFCINGALALGSVTVHIVASLVSDPRKRPLHAAIAVVSLIYVIGYTWVIFDGDPIAWSRLFRGVSIIVWPLVWAAPAIQDMVLFGRDGRRIQRQADQP